MPMNGITDSRPTSNPIGTDSGMPTIVKQIAYSTARIEVTMPCPRTQFAITRSTSRAISRAFARRRGGTMWSIRRSMLGQSTRK